LVAIGTHDLSTVKGPFTYAGESPSSISFRPLFQDKVFSGPELDELYGKDVRFGPYLAIINKGPRWPLIRDSAGTVLSMPPVINGFHSRLTLETRDVLIECTGTDLTKCHWVLNTIASSFAEACEAPFVVEQVKIVYEAGGEGKDEVTPNLGVRVIKVPGDVIVQGTGIPKEKLSVPDMARLLTRMQLPSVPTADGLAVEVTVPAVRTDILHAADIIEDVAIAYGFNKIESRLPTCLTIGTPQPISELTDHIRASMAMAGFTEAVTLVLCSKPECFADLRVSPAEPGPADAALIANPRTNEFEVARTTLLAGMLKTLAHNKATALPLKLFEVADVVVPSPGSETLFRNERRLCASYLNSTGGGFEIIHGLVDRFFQVLGVHVHNKSLAINKYKHGSRGSLSYEIEDGAHPSYFPGRCAKVVLYRKEADKEQEVKTDLGFFGLIHPEVLEKFDIALPAAVVEINVEPFLL
jgi:phenylalanyl-tRNA synthetase beta chain